MADCVLNKLSWNDDDIKSLILIADAPNHGNRFTGYNNSDYYYNRDNHEEESTWNLSQVLII